MSRLPIKRIRRPEIKRAIDPLSRLAGMKGLSVVGCDVCLCVIHYMANQNCLNVCFHSRISSES